MSQQQTLCPTHGTPRAIGAECRECVNARSREWYAANRERVSARHREYYIRNRARIAEYNAAAYKRRKAEGAR